MKDLKKAEPLFTASIHPLSSRTAIVEETATCAWLYLSGKNKKKIEKDVWLYNLIDAPERSEISKYRGEAPPAVKDYISLPGTMEEVREENLEFRWSEDGEAVSVWIVGELHAFILPGAEKGFSRLLKQKSPWGNPIDAEQYDKHLSS